MLLFFTLAGARRMSVTSLKLPDELKKRIAALVAGSGRSAYAFMVEAIARETERAPGVYAACQGFSIRVVRTSVARPSKR